MRESKRCPHGSEKYHSVECNPCPHGYLKKNCKSCKAARAGPPKSKRIKRESESSPEVKQEPR